MVEDLIDVEPFAIDEVLKGARVEKLHHNEGLPVRLDDLANGANVGVIQRGGPGTAMILGHSHYDQEEPNSKPQNDLERAWKKPTANRARGSLRKDSKRVFQALWRDLKRSLTRKTVT